MDYSVVTLLFEKKYREIDLEIPLKIPIEELSRKMTDTLKAIDYGRFAGISNIGIMFNGNVLNPENTLEDYGVWDGSYLTIIEN